MAHTIQFVDAIDAGANVLLDINADEFRCIRFVPNPPGLRRSVSSNLMRDGAHFGPSSYDSRTIDVTIELVAGNADDWAASFQVLARLLDQETAILRYQREGATHPVFFKTHRTDISEILEVTSYRVRDQVSFTIPADPHAPGLEESFSGSFSMDGGDSGGLEFTCPTIKGDVAAPLIVDLFGIGLQHHVVSRGALVGAAFPTIGRGLANSNITAGTDTTTTTSAGTGYWNAAYLSCSFATTATDAIRGTATVSLPVAGTYRALARMEMTSGSAEVYVSRKVQVSGVPTYQTVATGDAVTVTGKNIYDLGLFGVRAAGSTLWDIHAARSSGGSLRVNGILLVPAIVDAATVESWARMYGKLNTSLASPALRIDSAAESLSVYDGATPAETGEPATVAGSFPYVSPLGANRLRLIVDGTDNTVTTDAVDFTAYYHPLYTTVRPVAT